MSAQEFDFSKRIPQLDGLRGIAILSVLLFHFYESVLAQSSGFWARLLTPLTIGWCGVDLFFVLSGFLIGGILLDARGSRSYFRTFYTRRVCRIFPLYFVFVGVAVLCCRWAGWRVTIPWWSCSLFLQNFWISFHKTDPLAVVPTWSLAVEEQFYLTVPAVIWFARPRQLPKVLVGGIGTAVLARVAFLCAVHSAGDAVYSLLPCRMDSLLIGVMTAWLLRKPNACAFVRAHLRDLWLAIEVLTVSSSVFFFFKSNNGWTAALIVYDSLALLFACVIVASLVDEQVGRLLTLRWLRGLGAISYGVYILHALVWNVTLVVAPRLGVAGSVLIGTAATLVVAKISWEYFEKPIVRLGHRAVYARPTSMESPVATGSVVAVDWAQGESVDETFRGARNKA